MPDAISSTESKPSSPALSPSYIVPDTYRSPVITTVPSIRTLWVKKLPLIRGFVPPIHNEFEEFVNALQELFPIKIFEEPLLFLPAL